MSAQLVLIVSADPKEQRVLTVSLRKAGLGVRRATDGFDALHQLEEDDGRISVVIVDLELPQMDGFEFCERMRENARFDTIALVAVTGNRDLSTKLRAFEVGYEELIHKPVFIKEVAARVELLMQRRAHDELVEASAKEVSGSLDAVSVIDLIQAVEAKQKTGHARLIGPSGEPGTLFFEQGVPIDAEVGNMRGIAALNRLLRWEEGTFAVKYLPRIRRRRRIHKDPDVLVAEGLERMERFYQLLSTLPPMDRLYEVDYDAVGSELSTMPEPVRIMLRLFDGLRTLEQVISDAPVDDLEALRVVERLLVNAQVVEVPVSKVRQVDDEDEDTSDQDSALLAWLGFDPDITPPPPGWQQRTAFRERMTAREAMGPRAKARWEHEAEARNIIEEAARREGERAQLEDERRRLRDEQSSILDALARSKPEPPKVTHHYEAPGEVDTDPGDWDTPDSGDDHFPYDDAFDSAPGQRKQDLAAALHDHMSDAFGALQDEEPEPEDQARDPQAVAWMEAVRSHEAQYRVYKVEHTLKKRTLIVEDSDEVRARGFGRARLAVSDVYDAVPPVDDAEIDVDVRFESGPIPSVRVEAEMAAETSWDGPQDRSPQRSPDWQAVDNVRASAERRRAEYERHAAESVRSTERRRAEYERYTEQAASDDQHQSTEHRPEPEPLRGPAPSYSASPGMVGAMDDAGLPDEANYQGSAKASVQAENLPVESPRERRRSGPRLETPSARSSAPDLTPISSPEMAAVDRRRVSGTFEHNFFQPSGEFEATKRSSKAPTYILLAILIIMMGAVLYVVLFNSGEKPEPEKEVQAEKAEPETTPPAEDPFEENDPFEDEAATEPLASPEVIDAEYQANSAAEGVLKTATAVASLTAGRPEDTSIAGVDEPEAPAPEPKKVESKPKEAPKPKKVASDKPKEAPKPKKVASDKPASDKPKDKPASDKPKDEPSVSIEKSSGGGVDKLISAGKKAYKGRKYADAIKKLEQAVAKESGNTEANYYLGLSYAKAGNAKMALKHLEKVKGAKKGKAEFWKELGTVYIRLKKEKDGLEAYRKAVDLLGPDHPDAKKLQKYLDSRS